jgi:hypothetical protein
MTGGGVVHKGGVLPLEDVSFISNREIEEWEICIPPIWCGHYAWLNSGIKTLKYLKKEELIKDINIDYNLASAVARRPYKKILRKYSLKFASNKIKYITILFQLLLKKCFIKIVNNSGYAVKQSIGVNNIIEAERFFTEHTSHKFDE